MHSLFTSVSSSLKTGIIKLPLVLHAILFPEEEDICEEK